MVVELGTRTTSVRKAQYAYATLTALLADATRLAAAVAGGSTIIGRLYGGYTEGDGGACEFAIQQLSGAESWVTANGITFAAGGQIRISNSGSGAKIVWPERVINAVALGAKSAEWSSTAGSITACDDLFSKSNSILTDGYTLHFPAGTFHHKDQRFSATDRNHCAVTGEGIGRTIFHAGAQASYGPGDVPTTAGFQFVGGTYNRFQGLSYHADWYRYRAFWMRSGYGVIEDCYAQETVGRTFAVGNDTGAAWDSLDTTLFHQEMRNCVSYRSAGTAFSMYGNYWGKITGCRVEKCWAEAFTTDVCNNAEVENNYANDFCRQDDMAGFPVEGLYNGITGNGGIGGIGAATCNHVRVVGNVMVGMGQDDAASSSRDKPFIRWRPNLNTTNEGLVVAGNTFKDGFLGIHVEKHFQPENSTAPTPVYGQGKYVTITGNEFFNISQNSGQGHVLIDDGNTNVYVAGNVSDDTFKVFSAAVSWSWSGTEWVDGTVVDDTMATLPNQVIVIQNGGIHMGGPDWITALTFTAPPTVSGTSPSYRYIETDAAADNQRWRLSVLGGAFKVRAVNDAGDTFGDGLVIARTGTTVDEVELNATTLDFNGAVDCSSTVNAATEYRVGGTKVVGTQQAGIADSSDATVTEYRDKINAIIAVLEAHGLTATV